ncbi:MAG TPA: hypothetical protein VHX88_05450 [Solirubrobacteraceae bacterium]|jgi:hypothetical protein|nr:hypothetical protein [Solirubrobacteraceae bacterium]
MTEVPAALAIALVHDGLREDVLGAVEHDRHASSALKAALGILRNVASELQAGEAWCAPVLAAALPDALRWPEALRAAAPHAAAQVERSLAQASGLVETDPPAARTHLLHAAERALAEAWRHEELRAQGLLTEVRRVVRADLDAQVARMR